MNEHNHESLSDKGRQRRDAMLHELVGEMRDLHARRRTRRRATLMACAAGLIAIIVAIAMPRPISPPAPQLAHDQVDSPDSPDDSIHPDREDAQPIEHQSPTRTVIVQTDPTIVDRYIVRTGPHRAIILTDEELIDTLEAIGRPAGLVRMNEKVWLTAKVTDEERRNGM